MSIPGVKAAVVYKDDTAGLVIEIDGCLAQVKLGHSAKSMAAYVFNQLRFQGSSLTQDAIQNSLVLQAIEDLDIKSEDRLLSGFGVEVTDSGAATYTTKPDDNRDVIEAATKIEVESGTGFGIKPID